MTPQAAWREIRLRLHSDVGVIEDCARRLRDGVEDLGPERPQFDYVERQLLFLAERVSRAQDLVNDVRRDGPADVVATNKGGGA